MQITRQRISQNVEERTSEKWPYLRRNWKNPVKYITFNSIENWIKKFKTSSDESNLELVVILI